MGTSSSYGGPQGKSPLLPKDFDENDYPNEESNMQEEAQEEGKPNLKTDLWKRAKTQASKFVSGTSGNIGLTLSGYVKAHGGGRKAASTAFSGKSTSVGLGAFLSSTSAQGIKNTLVSYDIEYEGRGAEEVLSDLVNKIGPSPNTKEDSVARNALLDAIDILYEDVEEQNDDLEALNNLDKNRFNKIMNVYISSYIYQRFLSELESRFEEYASSAGTALAKEEEIREYISGIVDNKLQNRNFSELDYSSNSILVTINEIFTDCYDVIEGALK